MKSQLWQKKRQGGHLGDLARTVTLLIPTHLSPASFQVGQKHQAAFIPGRLFLHSPFQNVCKVGFFGDPGCHYTLCHPPWFLLKLGLSVAWKSPSRQAIPRDLLVSASTLLSPRSHLHGLGLELRACACVGSPTLTREALELLLKWSLSSTQVWVAQAEEMRVQGRFSLNSREARRKEEKLHWKLRSGGRSLSTWELQRYRTRKARVRSEAWISHQEFGFTEAPEAEPGGWVLHGGKDHSLP